MVDSVYLRQPAEPQNFHPATEPVSSWRAHQWASSTEAEAQPSDGSAFRLLRRGVGDGEDSPLP